jgi:hypothetical protein
LQRRISRRLRDELTAAGGTTGDSTVELFAGGQANTCSTEPNNSWLALEGGC